MEANRGNREERILTVLAFLQAELEAKKEALYNEATESVTKALQSATSFQDGVPVKEELEAAQREIENATEKYTELDVVQPLTEVEEVTLSKLQTHEQGVINDPDRFKSTWSDEKEQLLEKLRTRTEVVMRMRKVSETFDACKERFDIKTDGDRLFSLAWVALEQSKIGETRKLSHLARATYLKSGYTRTDVDMRRINEPLMLMGAVKLQSVWRGILGRRRASNLRWGNDKFRLEASSLFLALDADHGGTLSRDELSDGLTLVGYSSAEIKKVLSFLDADGDGEITLEEFIMGFREALGGKDKEDATNVSKVSSTATQADGSAGALKSPQREADVDRDTLKEIDWDNEPEEKQVSKASSSMGDLPMDGGGTVGRSRTGATTHLFAELHYSAKKGDVIRCWALINRTQVPVNARTTNGTTPLHLAAWEGHISVINVLVALGAQLDSRTEGGYTPLHCAATSNHVDAIRELVRVRADVSVRESRSGASPLHWAARGGHLEAIAELIEQRAKVDIHDTNQNTPLMYAARHAHTEAVELLLEKNASLQATNSDGRSALFHAAEAGATDTALRLIHVGANVGQLQDYGRSAADLAESRGFSETARVMREWMKQKDQEANAPLMIKRSGTDRRMQINDMFQLEAHRGEEDNSRQRKTHAGDYDAITDGRMARRRGGIHDR